MHLFFSFILTAFLLPPTSGPALETVSVAQPAHANPRYCRIYGSVYLERDPARKAGTHFSVYEEEEAAFATMAVYKETNKLFADAPGLWYLAPSRNFADYVIFVTPNRNLADFSMHFTESRSFAGCKN